MTRIANSTTAKSTQRTLSLKNTTAGLALYSLVLFVSCLEARSIWASEWTTLKDGKSRIVKDATSEAEPAPPISVPLPEGHYEPGQGSIEGAFGLEFGTPLNATHIRDRLGWHEVAELPDDLQYRGLIQPLTIERVTLNPPQAPKLLIDQSTTFFAYIDFDGRPIRIETSTFSNAGVIIDIIERKYGEPDQQEDLISTYVRGDHSLRIVKARGNDRATLVYQDHAAFEVYMTERNRSLKRKFRKNELDRLTPREQAVVKLAEQLVEFRQGGGTAFGLPFGQRVGFRADPDEFIDFEAPEKLLVVAEGQYKIMVSPDLMPVAVRYQYKGDKQELEEIKSLMEHGMELAFAGFLKQTPRHSVVSFDQNAYSLLIREGGFYFTVHNRTENKQRNDRVKAAKVAAAEAEAERKRLAELERQRQEIAARQRQIKEESAF